MLRNLIEKLTNKKNMKKKGFTLIELIIVIAIIAILAAIALPKFAQYRESANEKDDLAAAKNISTAVSTLMADQKGGVAEGDDFSIGDSSTESTAVIELLEGGKPTPKSKNHTSDMFHVKVAADGSIKVDLNGTSVYPTNDLGK